jgi:hypothetical protein
LSYENHSGKILGFKQNEQFVEEEEIVSISPSLGLDSLPALPEETGWHLDKTAALNPYSHLI